MLRGKLIMDFIRKDTSVETYIENHNNFAKACLTDELRFSEYAEKLKGIDYNTEAGAEEALKVLEDYVIFRGIEPYVKPDFRISDYRKEYNFGNINLEGKIVLLMKEVLKSEFHEDELRAVEITGGYGADPDKIGKAIYVRFIEDGEKAKFQRHHVECVLVKD